MSATDEVRAELTKRGVKWIDIPLVSMSRTCWKASNKQDGYCYYEEDEYGTELTISRATPEQAIEATIGRGTCHITPKFTCSACGHQYPTRNYESYETCDGRTAFAPLGYNVLNCRKPNYCPQCGRRVKEVYEC
ncbi:MAG: hypothetical protein IKF78_00120 [Atopobiaceae bacterium]|nr:hypothetical protein [Atopobiaceae bacterium]